MHDDDLNTIWRCCDCGRNFVFSSDVEDHKKEFSHSCMKSYNIVVGNSNSLVEFTYGKAALNFKINDKLAIVTIEYKYYPYDDSLTYIDVIYSNTKLRSMIEGNKDMMRNIDNYIRRLEQKSARKKAPSAKKDGTSTL